MIVVWRITQHCNLACPFCAYDRGVERPRSAATRKAVLDFGAVLAAYQRETADPVLVSWLGGEPFLWPLLEEITTTFTREFGLRVSATTNGTALSSTTVRAHVLEHYAELTVSVDAIGSEHEQLRGWPAGFSTLRNSIRALVTERAIRESQMRLRANVVLMRHTVSRFAQLSDELADWGVDEITFNQLGGRDRPEFYPNHSLQPEQALWLAEEVPGLRSRLAGRGVRLNGGAAYLNRILATTRGEKIPVDDCHPGERFLFVSENGTAAPCSFTVDDYGTPLEKLNSAASLRELPQRFAETRNCRRSDACGDCHSTQVFEKFEPLR